MQVGLVFGSLKQYRHNIRQKVPMKMMGLEEDQMFRKSWLPFGIVI